MSTDSKKDGTGTGVTLALDRRTFLQALGTAFSVAALPEVLASCTTESEPVAVNEEELVVDGGTYSVVRPSDLLVLNFGLVNLKRDTTTNLLVKNVAGEAYVMVDFPSQAILEQAIAPKKATSTQFVLSRIGGRSRLVFRVPTTFKNAKFTLENLLALCGTSDLVIPSEVAGRVASVPPQPPADASMNALIDAAISAGLAPLDADSAGRLMAMRHAPQTPPHVSSGTSSLPLSERTVSYVEMPFRLQLAPNEYAAWAHVNTPLQSPVSGRTELWHTVLGVRAQDATSVDEKNAFFRTARAVHTRDGDVAVTGEWVTDPAYLPSLTKAQRDSIVANTCGGAKTVPLQVNRMMLSALGGYLDVKGDFADVADDNNNDLLAWSHRMAGGRENYVETIEAGLILPFSFEASNTTITVRSDNPQNAPIGQLYQFGIITIRNPVVRFLETGSAATAANARRFPFVAIEAKKTSFIVASQTANGLALDLSGQPVSVPVVGYDRRGRAAEFSVPLIYVAGEAPPTTAQYTAFTDALSALPGAASRTYLELDLGGQRVAYARSNSDNTTFATTKVLLGLLGPSGDEQRLRPKFVNMVLDIESIRSFTDGTPKLFAYHEAFVQHGLPASNTDPNKSQYLLKYTPDTGSPTISVDFRNRPDGGTGFVAPNTSFNAISAVSGPVYDATVLSLGDPRGKSVQAPTPADADGGFNPESFFAPIEADLDKLKILGVFALTEIIQAVSPDQVLSDLQELDSAIVDNALRYAPKFVAEGYHALEQLVGALVSLRSQIETLYAHAKELQGKAVGTVKTDVTKLKNALKAIYGTLQAAIGDLENRDICQLTGLKSIPGFQPLSPRTPAAAPARLKTLATNITTLRAAMDKLATDAAAGASAVGANGPVTIVAGLREAIDKKLLAVEGFIGTQASEYAAKVQAIVDMVTAVEQAVDAARDMTLKLEWQPKIGPVVVGALADFQPSSAHGLTLAFEARPKAQGDKPAGMDVACRLDAFQCRIGLIKGTDDALISFQFKHLYFKKDAGKKPDVDVVFDGLHFGGKLQFLETLRRIIPLDGFSDPPFLDVSLDGIRAGFTLAVPNVALGMFSLENIKISAELKLPLFADGAATKVLTFTFKFCDRDDPFLVTVSMLGGGGYFVLTVTPEGLQHLEASINVGAQIALNFAGLASGSVSISAGIIVAYDEGTGVSISGFLRLHGELDVLGLVSISVDLRVTMTYEEQTKTVVATAVIHASIHILFFSTSVDIPFERRFSSCNGDPTLRELMGPNETSSAWQQYCTAYATTA